MPTFSSKHAYFFSQVHQPFFLLGVLNALISMVLFLLAYKGVAVLEIQPLDFHGFSLFYLVFTNFFVGFIFTTYPRFTAQEPIKQNYYLKLLALSCGASVLFYIGALFSFWLVVLSFIALVGAFGMVLFVLQKLYTHANIAVRADPFWILLGFYAGGIGLLWYALYFANFVASPSSFVFYLYFVYVTFSVAQRMVPFFSHSHAAKNGLFAPVVFVGLALKVLFLGVAPFLNIALDLLLGGYVLYEFLRWHVDFKNAPAILKILHIALAWFVFAFLFGAVFELYGIYFHTATMQLQLHLFALGFVTVMLIGFGTRVALGHSGQPPHANSYTVKLFYLLNLVVIARALFSLVFTFDMNIFWLFDLSITLFVLLFVSWAWKFAPVLLFGKKVD
jgi:uncharacterized protein involved in response to NO